MYVRERIKVIFALRWQCIYTNRKYTHIFGMLYGGEYSNTGRGARANISICIGRGIPKITVIRRVYDYGGNSRARIYIGKLTGPTSNEECCPFSLPPSFLLLPLEYED